jgi:curved DNA-binding protein CbpA
MHSSLFPYSPERDAYVLLGVPSTASTDEVNAACRRLARTFHPDRNGSTRATAEMAVVNSVRQVMVDPDARAAYDHERRSFHEIRAKAIRDRVEPPRASAGLPAITTSAPATAVGRYASGVGLGLVAAMRELLPPRCRGCHAVVMSPADAFCAACGTPLPVRA